MPPTKISVLIVDDHAGVRRGLRYMLEEAPDIVVVGEAANGTEALDKAHSLLPDVVLLDVELLDLRGDEVARRLKINGVKTRILAISSYDDEQYIHSMLENGASGYLTKAEAAESLLHAVRQVSSGERWLSRQARHKTRLSHSGELTLTLRELDFINLLAKGDSEERIAQKMGIGTVRVQSIFTLLKAKLNVESAAELIQYARKKGLV